MTKSPTAVSIPSIPTPTEPTNTRTTLPSTPTFTDATVLKSFLTTTIVLLSHRRRIQTFFIGPMDIFSRRISIIPTGASSICPLSTARKMFPATLARTILRRIAEILDPSNIDAPTPRRKSCGTFSTTYMKLSISPYTHTPVPMF